MLTVIYGVVINKAMAFKVGAKPNSMAHLTKWPVTLSIAKRYFPTKWKSDGPTQSAQWAYPPSESYPWCTNPKAWVQWNELPGCQRLNSKQNQLIEKSKNRKFPNLHTLPFFFQFFYLLSNASSMKAHKIKWFIRCYQQLLLKWTLVVILVLQPIWLVVRDHIFGMFRWRWTQFRPCPLQSNLVL